MSIYQKFKLERKDYHDWIKKCNSNNTFCTTELHQCVIDIPKNAIVFFPSGQSHCNTSQVQISGLTSIFRPSNFTVIFPVSPFKWIYNQFNKFIYLIPKMFNVTIDNKISNMTVKHEE